jgi:transposase InsO family protein
MKGYIGTPCVLRSCLPHRSRLAKIPHISKEAKRRLRWFDYYRKWGNARLVCRHFGINPKIFYKWKKRLERQGSKGLENLSRKPHQFRQSKIPLEWIDKTISLRKKYPYFSKYKLAVILERDDGLSLSPSSVGRIIKRYNLFLTTPYPSKKARYKRARLPKGFKIKNPGDLIQRDVKYLPFLGRTNYCFVAIDCKGKGLAVKIASSISSLQGKRLNQHLERYFPFKIKNEQNDNGSENLKYTYKDLKEKNINQYFSYPNCPKENSFVERVIGTIEREFIQQGKLAQTIEEQQKLIDRWLDEYHNFRPHQSLNYLTPNEYYQNTIGKKINVLPMY